MHAAHATLLGEFENALGSRIDRAMERVAEAGQLLTRASDIVRHGRGDLGGRLPVTHPGRRALEQPGALLGGAEDHRSAPQDARRDRALERAGIGRERHPSRDVRRHHPVLGDRHEQRIEEEALLLRRLAAGQQKMEVLGEADVPDQLVRQIAAAYLDTIRISLADVGDRIVGATDLHATRRYQG